MNKVSYYINLVLEAIGIQDTQTKIWVNGVLQVWNLIVAAGQLFKDKKKCIDFDVLISHKNFIFIGASLLVERVGRRVLFITSNVGMLICLSLLSCFCLPNLSRTILCF